MLPLLALNPREAEHGQENPGPGSVEATSEKGPSGVDMLPNLESRPRSKHTFQFRTPSGSGSMQKCTLNVGCVVGHTVAPKDVSRPRTCEGDLIGKQGPCRCDEGS